MSSSQRQEIVTLIDNKDKDRSLLDNWKPISLLNTDWLKFFSKALAFRINKVLPNIIHHNQSGYVEGRYIGETIRTIYDIMDFTKSEGGIFKKAFDSIEWNFIHRCLEVFGSGFDFIRWFSVLYQGYFQLCLQQWRTLGFLYSRKRCSARTFFVTLIIYHRDRIVIN